MEAQNPPKRMRGTKTCSRPTSRPIPKPTPRPIPKRTDPWPFIPPTTPNAFDVFREKIRQLAHDAVAIPLKGSPMDIALNVSMMLSKFAIMIEMADQDGTDVCNCPKIWTIFTHLSRVTYKLFKKCNLVFERLVDLDAFLPSIDKLKTRFQQIQDRYEKYVYIFLNDLDLRHLKVVLAFKPVSYKHNMTVLTKIPRFCKFQFWDSMGVNRDHDVFEFNMRYTMNTGTVRDFTHAVSDIVVYHLRTLQDCMAQVVSMHGHVVTNEVLSFFNAQRALEKIKTERLKAMEADMERFQNHLQSNMNAVYPDGVFFIHMHYMPFSAIEESLYGGPIFKPTVDERFIRCCTSMVNGLRKRLMIPEDAIQRLVRDLLLLDDSNSLFHHRFSVVFTVGHSQSGMVHVKIM